MMLYQIVSYHSGMGAPLGYVAGVGRGATGFTTRYLASLLVVDFCS